MIYVLEIKERAIGKGRPRFNRVTGKAYTPEKTEAFEELIKWKFINKYNVDQEVSSLPFKANIDIQFAPPQKTGQLTRLQMEGTPYIKKPDIDNVVKLIFDALNGLAYKDDNQITEMHVTKQYGQEDKITILLEEI